MCCAAAATARCWRARVVVERQRCVTLRNLQSASMFCVGQSLWFLQTIVVTNQEQSAIKIDFSISSEADWFQHFWCRTNSERRLKVKLSGGCHRQLTLWSDLEGVELYEGQAYKVFTCEISTKCVFKITWSWLKRISCMLKIGIGAFGGIKKLLEQQLVECSPTEQL